jgi:hypothetical protein
MFTSSFNQAQANGDIHLDMGDMSHRFQFDAVVI